MPVWPLPKITFRELSLIEETRPVALLTSDEVWAIHGSQITLPVIIQAEPNRYDRELFDYLADNLPAQAGVIYAVGQGAPVMAGKIAAARNDVPLVVVPTMLDSDWMLTPRALVTDAVEDESRLVWEETGPASEIVIDWGVIQAAPPALRGGGIVDVLSIVTGLLDWRYAAQKGKNPVEQRFESWAASVVAGLASQAIKSAAAIGQGDRSALELLLNWMLTAVQISNQLQHTRAVHGAEHYLAHALMAQGTDLPHSQIVGPCLLLASALHGQAPTGLRGALEQAGIPLDQLRATDVRLVLDNLPAYIQRYDFPYSILNEIDPAAERTAQALDAAGLTVQPDTWQSPSATQHTTPTSEAPVSDAPVDETTTAAAAVPKEEAMPSGEGNAPPAAPAAPSSPAADSDGPAPAVPDSSQGAPG